ncbi:hypothetical protein [Nocardioides solisilvae]|uniref:hypothetical protein n=1 Tax=Nocardioides solisilvae TaxID=1542435 RepID=UPI000D7427E0|nr:hypothetical protein [Nocardioides solisilvae]
MSPTVSAQQSLPDADHDEMVMEDVAEPEKIWAEAARTVLLEVAGRYNAVTTSKELAAAVQERTGVVTDRAAHYWVGEVLALVAEECHDLEEPLLPSLCVNPQGAVVPAYARVLRDIRGETPEDVDKQAADERLALYRRHDATGLPADGGHAELTPRLAASRARDRKNRLAERVLPVCPTCYQELASTGVCDHCD